MRASNIPDDAAARLREARMYADNENTRDPDASGKVDDPEPWANATVRTAPASLKPCELYTYHAPAPVITQGHHVHPVFLQNRVYGQIRDNTLKYLCGSCHDTVHAWLYWLLGERARPEGVGYLAKREAQTTYDWYQGERGTLL